MGKRLKNINSFKYPIHKRVLVVATQVCDPVTLHCDSVNLHRGYANKSSDYVPENVTKSIHLMIHFIAKGVFLLDSTGLDWTGLDWTGLDWTGLDWTGLDSAPSEVYEEYVLT